MVGAIVGAVGVVVWMACYVVGLAILEFSLVPGILMGAYVLRCMAESEGRREYRVGYRLFGAFAFAYGCAVPVWYSAAIYSVYGFVVDRRTICLGFLVFFYMVANDLWRRLGGMEYGSREEYEEEESMLFVWVSFPLLLLAGICLVIAYRYAGASAWVFYGVSISAGLLHVLNRRSGVMAVERLRFYGCVAMLVPVLVLWLSGGGA